MSNIYDVFGTFAPETWSFDGIVSRIKKHAAQSDTKRSVSPFASKVAVAFMAISIGVTAAVPLPAWAQSDLHWRCAEPIVSGALNDADVVPLNFWPGAISRLQAKKVVIENNFFDIDSPF